MADVGRPTKYSEAYCNEVISCMGQGFSLTAFAGEIGVSRECVYEWQRVHPEFSDAVKIAKAKRLRFLEERLLDGETGPRVTSHIFALKNACPEEWADKQRHELTGKDGESLKTDKADLLEAAREIAFALNRGARISEEVTNDGK